jgi:cytochrome c peroxidase
MTFSYFSFFGLALSLIISKPAFSDSVDNYLHNRLKFFDITPYESLPTNNADDYRARVELGQKLFIETNLSGNRNVSCMTCHNPMKGTSDGHALSQTGDGKGVLRRNASNLYNVGDKYNTFMFWDGRVHFNPDLKFFETPEPALNGVKPKAPQITSVLKSALSAQTLFPMVAHDEMAGRAGENEIGSAKDNLEAWDLLVKRITTESDAKTYVSLFNRAYPELAGDVKKINIGHAGEALATFMRDHFQSNTSPFHRYVAGDDTAMTQQQKKGLMVFIGANCIACHQGNLLGNNSFFASVGVPSFGAKPFAGDLGRGEVNNEKFRNHFFRTPSLINVALTAPYMHNGAFKTIREVLNHYNDVGTALSHFELGDRQKEFPVEIEVLNSEKMIEEIFDSMQAGFLKGGLGLSEKDLDDLEVFLTEGLTDPKWDTRNATKKLPR